MQIHESARKGDISAVRRELELGTHVDVRDPRTDLTPLAVVAASPHASKDLMKLLLDRGADPNAKCKGSPVLFHTVKQWDVARIALLLESGADIRYRSSSGYDALITCLYQKRVTHDSRLLPTVDFLIRHGAPTNGRSDFGETAITVASIYGRFDVVKLLVDAGASSAGLLWTPLHRAVVLETLEDVREQLKDPAALSVGDHHERSAFLLAVHSGDMAKAQLLATRGAVASESGRGGKRALQYAAERGHREMIDWLISAGHDVNTQDAEGRTALMTAAESDLPEVVSQLLKSGADSTLENVYGESAIAVADSPEVYRVLRDSGTDVADVPEEVRQELTRVGSDPLVCSLEEFEAGRDRKFGIANPTLFNIPFWRAMVRARAQAYDAPALFQSELTGSRPIWCYSRFGQSITELPDGRVVEVGGEHEDCYDPDFCIYNDVVVYDGGGDFLIYGYPRKLFPPTDFHTATLVYDWIYLIGSLGYGEDRRVGQVQVLRLSTLDFHIESVATTGDGPGWISRHRARFEAPRSICVWGGRVSTEDDYVVQDVSYRLDLDSLNWTREQSS